MKILNYSVDDYYLQVNSMAGILALKGRQPGVCNYIRFLDNLGYPPSITEDRDLIDDTWRVGFNKEDGSYSLIKDTRKNTGDYNILQLGSYLKDGVTLSQSVELFITKKELASIRVLMGGNVREVAHNVYAMSGFILIPKTARYVLDGYVYSCATDRVLCKYDYKALESGKSQGRRLISPVKLVMR